MKKRLPFIIMTVIITLFIFNNSMQSAEDSGRSSGTIVNIIAEGISRINGGNPTDTNVITYFVRKAAHITEFALHGFFLTGCFADIYKKRIAYVLASGLLTACIDEYIQLFSPGRAAMLQDVFIDASGTAIGLLIFGLFYKLKNKGVRLI